VTYLVDMDIPNTYAEWGVENVPPGHTVEVVRMAELKAAGFQYPPSSSPLYQMLCDPDGYIVATWDEGRWWSPDEWDAHSDARRAAWERSRRRRHRRPSGTL
jgi:hypothetical protein